MTDQLGLDDNEQLRMGRPARSSVECLGLTFDSDDARREHFSAVLAEKLRDSAFRKQPGFPIGDDEDILKMSDPPYYTACPNPFLTDYAQAYGSTYDPTEAYHRDPFAVDVSVGKTDALYRAHAYHTKVPHLAIVPSILHYTEPGDVVLDGFCGSGMTGVAAQFCGSAPKDYRMSIDRAWAEQGLAGPQWGARRAILSDLSPAATFISAGYNIPFDSEEFEREARMLLAEVEAEIGWMYETVHTDGKTKGRINYTVWSEVFACPECGEEIVFFDAAFNHDTYTFSDTVDCPRCGANGKKESLDLQYETVIDPTFGCAAQQPKRRAVLINYRVGRETFEKRPTREDLDLVDRISALDLPDGFPLVALPDSQMSRVGRMATTKTSSVYQMYLPRARQAMTSLWRAAGRRADARQRAAAFFFVEQAIWGISLLNRYKALQHGQPGGSQVNNYMSGFFYISSTIGEGSPFYILEGKLKRLAKVFAAQPARTSTAIVSTGDCASMGVPDQSVDYIFTDPPFGENIYYADLNFLVESWHRVRTDAKPEAIVDRVRIKTVVDYQDLMRSCFEQYFRVLKPGRWMTVVFSNSSNAVWRAIQEALSSSGFVVADVRTLDKKQGSFRQVTTQAVKQDLIISAYRPSEDLQRKVGVASPGTDAAWSFVSEHLSNVPVVVSAGDVMDAVVERTPQMLHDRMVGFFVQRGLAVPLSTTEFLTGLSQRYSERDGMYFLSTQVAEYDKHRARVESVQQLALLVTDESSAIQWVRQQLADKPRTFSELQPTFMREAQQSWAKHEVQLELKELLEANFLLYDGNGPVPSQIKSYLSTNWREYRSMDSADPALQAKARDRWYVPDPGKAADLEKLRDRQLLREFEDYRASKSRKLKTFRTEAVRVGFRQAYEDRDWATIVAVAERLPEAVVQEDEKLLMYYDVARMRVG